MRAREKVQPSPWKTYKQAPENPPKEYGVIATWQYLHLDPIYYALIVIISMLSPL